VEAISFPAPSFLVASPRNGGGRMREGEGGRGGTVVSQKGGGRSVCWKMERAVSFFLSAFVFFPYLNNIVSNIVVY
jgi:hypothetical protein